jgi:hypothetical protein
MSLKKKLEKIADINEDKKEKIESKFFKNEWTAFGLPNPFDVVEKFIRDKGLKLYGGLALHTYLKKHKQGLYSKHEFPDFDVLSPDAWNHAKELARLLHKMGFMFVEARSSVLNDYHHQTYKVSVDMIYIIDITQKGCTPKQVHLDDCDTCGRSTKGKCLKLFDDEPAVDSGFKKTTKNPRIYRKTYNYRTKKSLFPKKLFVMDKNWLKGQMYKELTQPMGQPQRLPKVGTRLNKFKKFYDFEHFECSLNDYTKMVNKNMIPILKEIGEFIKGRSLVNYGATAYNFFVKHDKNVGSLPISDYKVYSENSIYHIESILKLLNKKFKNRTFNYIIKNKFWKEQEDVDYIVNVKIGDKFNNLITFTETDKCIPYVQYNKIRYATVDRLKYLYYKSLSTPTFLKNIEDNPMNYKCLLNKLLSAEKTYKKTKKNNKFRRYVSKCQGDEISKIHTTLTNRWYNKIKDLKDTEYRIDKPKKGYITKIYKMAEEEQFLPYKPEEEKLKIKT